MKKILFLLLMIPVLQASAQDGNFNHKTYKWSKELPSFTPAKADTEYADILLFNRQFVEYFDDTESKSPGIRKIRLHHKMKYVNDNKAVEDNNKIYLPVGAEQAVLTLRARVIKNGKVISESDKDDATVVEEEGNRWHQIALKGVEKGVIVETIMTYYLSTEMYDEDFLQFSAPARLSEFTLITPERLEFECKLYNTDATMTDSVHDERNLYFVSLKNVPAFNADELYALGSANKVRLEYCWRKNTSNDYKYIKFPEMGRQYFEGVQSDYKKNEKDLGKILAKAKIETYTTNDEKIMAIENYVKTTIANEQNAPGGQTVAKMVKDKMASRYDYNKLMIQLMRKAEIPHEVVLTCKREVKQFDEDFDSWSYLRDVLLYFPASKKFLDPQSIVYRYGRIDSDHLGQQGLFIKMLTVGDEVSASASIKSIPAPTSADNKDIENYTVTFTPDLEGVNIAYHREMNNYADHNYRAFYYINTEEKKKELIEGLLQGFDKESKVTEIDVKNYDLSSFSEFKKPFIIKANIASNHFNEKAGDKILFKVGELIGPQVEMFQEKPRQNPADIPFTHSYNRKIVITIPDGYQVKGLDKLPINLKITDKGEDLGGFVTTYELNGNILTIYNTEYYNTLHYDKSLFEAFRKVINASADFNKLSILLEKKK